MKKILMSTCMASGLVLASPVEGEHSPGVKLSIGGHADIMYGVRAGTYNASSESDASKLAIYNANGQDSALDRSSMAANAIVNLELEGYRSSKLQYFGNLELYGNTSSADYAVDTAEQNEKDDARVRQAFIGISGDKWGKLSAGSMQSITKSFKDDVVTLPWMASDRLQYWLPTIYQTSNSGNEVLDQRFLIENELYGNTLFFSHLPLYMKIGLDNKYGQLYPHFSDRRKMNKKVYGNRISYTSPMFKGITFGASYAPWGLHTGAVRVLDDLLEMPQDVKKTYVKNLLDLGVKYESVIGPVGFSAYVGFERGSIPDISFEYDSHNLRSTYPKVYRSYNLGRKLQMFEGGFSIGCKGVTFSLSGGKYDKGLNPNLSVATFKAEALSDLEKMKEAVGNITIVNQAAGAAASKAVFYYHQGGMLNVIVSDAETTTTAGGNGNPAHLTALAEAVRVAWNAVSGVAEIEKSAFVKGDAQSAAAAAAAQTRLYIVNGTNVSLPDATGSFSDLLTGATAAVEAASSVDGEGGVTSLYENADIAGIISNLKFLGTLNGKERRDFWDLAAVGNGSGDDDAATATGLLKDIYTATAAPLDTATLLKTFVGYGPSDVSNAGVGDLVNMSYIQKVDDHLRGVGDPDKLTEVRHLLNQVERSNNYWQMGIAYTDKSEKWNVGVKHKVTYRTTLGDTQHNKMTALNLYASYKIADGCCVYLESDNRRFIRNSKTIMKPELYVAGIKVVF